jgi:hypothetical protein
LSGVILPSLRHLQATEITFYHFSYYIHIPFLSLLFCRFLFLTHLEACCFKVWLFFLQINFQTHLEACHFKIKRLLTASVSSLSPSLLSESLQSAKNSTSLSLQTTRKLCKYKIVIIKVTGLNQLFLGKKKNFLNMNMVKMWPCVH